MFKNILLTLLLLFSSLYAYDARLDNYPNGRALYEKASANDVDSAFDLALLYKQKIKDYKEAAFWYKKSYKLGSIDAAFNVGNMYNQLKDYDSAETWYKKAIEKGDGEAAFNLGNMYKVKLKEYAGAVEFYKTAYMLGQKEAPYTLALMYKEQLKDNEKAIKWYKNSYAIGNIAGANGLGYTYEHTLNDLKNAEVWYKKASKKNDKQSIGNLAKLYHKQNKDELGAAYLIALINNGYSKSKVLGYLKNKWQLSDVAIQKAYKLQLTLDIPKHYKDGIN